MKRRILFFEDEHEIRRPLSNFLRSRGFEVMEFPSPLSCALVANKECTCPREHACADMVITDMQSPGMAGLELVRLMAENGCRIATRNKIIISSSISAEQAIESRTLGCHSLSKPFRFEDMLCLVEVCEEGISPDRILAPVEELWKTVRNHQ
jgi:DNA-binding response OmpR family regulator